MAGAVEYELKRLQIAYELLDAGCILTTGTPAYRSIYDARKAMEELIGDKLELSAVRSSKDLYKVIESTKWGALC